MPVPIDNRDERRAQISANGQWLSTYAWGLSVLAAILAAVIAWAAFGG